MRTDLLHLKLGWISSERFSILIRVMQSILLQLRHTGDMTSLQLPQYTTGRITITIQTGGPPTLSGGVAAHLSGGYPGEVKAWASTGWGCRDGHPRGRGLDPPVGVSTPAPTGVAAHVTSSGGTMRASRPWRSIVVACAPDPRSTTIPAPAARHLTPALRTETALVGGERHRRGALLAHGVLRPFPHRETRPCDTGGITTSGAGSALSFSPSPPQAGPSDRYPARHGTTATGRNGPASRPSRNPPPGFRGGRRLRASTSAGQEKRSRWSAPRPPSRSANPPPRHLRTNQEERKSHAVDYTIGGTDHTVPPRD